jgi:hypothetical protein
MRQFVQHHYMPSKTTDKKKKKNRTELRVCVCGRKEEGIRRTHMYRSSPESLHPRPPLVSALYNRNSSHGPITDSSRSLSLFSSSPISSLHFPTIFFFILFISQKENQVSRKWKRRGRRRKPPHLPPPPPNSGRKKKAVTDSHHRLEKSCLFSPTT